MAAIFLASALRNASGVSAVLNYNPKIVASRFLLDVTAAGSAADDTLDVFMQSSMDGGVSWDDLVHFTQVLGNGGPKQFLASWVRTLEPTNPLHAPQDAGMSAGVEQGPIGNLLRVKWVIVAGAGTHAFTFGIRHEPYR